MTERTFSFPDPPDEHRQALLADLSRIAEGTYTPMSPLTPGEGFPRSRRSRLKPWLTCSMVLGVALALWLLVIFAAVEFYGWLT